LCVSPVDLVSSVEAVAVAVVAASVRSASVVSVSASSALAASARAFACAAAVAASDAEPGVCAAGFDASAVSALPAFFDASFGASA